MQNWRWSIRTASRRWQCCSHGAAVEQIERIRRQGGTVPEAMAAVYEYLHKRQIDKSEKVRIFQKMYREK